MFVKQIAFEQPKIFSKHTNAVNYYTETSDDSSNLYIKYYLNIADTNVPLMCNSLFCRERPLIFVAVVAALECV